jgi:hypothetical protein
MVPHRSRGFARLVAVAASLVIGLVACGGSDEPSAKTEGATTTGGAQFPIARAADHLACVTSARAVEAAAALHYATSGSYGTIGELVSAGVLKNAPDPAWGLEVGPDGTVDDSKCP